MRTAVALVAALGFGLALAAPVPKAEEKLKPATGKERDEVKNNLKQIGLAMLNYESAFQYFPGDVLEPKTKKPLLSWRVAILPYIEEEDLYKAFKLDEPWDSESNKPLVEKVPKIYAPTRVKAKPGETFYRGFAGDGLFPAGRNCRIADVTDGLSNSVAVVDAGEPVLWTKPGTDIVVEAKTPLPPLGGLTDGEFYCVMGDGSVRPIRRDFDAKQLRLAASRADGLVLGTGLFADE